MHNSHYPSLELCKKLAEAGFHITDKFWQYGRICDSFRDRMVHKDAEVCPSVMELLDELPHVTEYGKLIMDSNGAYYRNGSQIWSPTGSGNSLPDSLSLIWLHLKEKDLLPKK